MKEKNNSAPCTTSNFKFVYLSLNYTHINSLQMQSHEKYYIGKGTISGLVFANFTIKNLN